jgi:hypothetical protein
MLGLIAVEGILSVDASFTERASRFQLWLVAVCFLANSGLNRERRAAQLALLRDALLLYKSQCILRRSAPGRRTYLIGLCGRKQWLPTRREFCWVERSSFRVEHPHVLAAVLVRVRRGNYRSIYRRQRGEVRKSVLVGMNRCRHGPVKEIRVVCENHNKIHHRRRRCRADSREILASVLRHPTILIRRKPVSREISLAVFFPFQRLH